VLHHRLKYFPELMLVIVDVIVRVIMCLTPPESELLKVTSSGTQFKDVQRCGLCVARSAQACSYCLPQLMTGRANDDKSAYAKQRKPLQGVRPTYAAL
jgi:hypothetical protein